MIRLFGNGLAAVLLIVGGLWVLQGTDALHGSPMSGQEMWATIGMMVVLVGLAVLWLANMRAGRH